MHNSDKLSREEKMKSFIIRILSLWLVNLRRDVIGAVCVRAEHLLPFPK